jgi:hypothetical protein
LIEYRENFVTNTLKNQFLSICFQENFPWYFLSDVAAKDTEENIKNFGFFHLLFRDEDKVHSEYLEYFWPMIYFIEEKFNTPVNKILRIRMGMNVRVSDKSIIHNKHTDYDYKHKTLLYYCNDSDGDTFFFDDNDKVIKKIKPKSGSAVLFDGLIKHSSSTPVKNNRRVAINVNFI